MDSLKLSIIMPAYNEGEHIKEIIDKLISLGYEKFELIIVDDGSTDCSVPILDEYSYKYDCIKVIHQENQGCVLARKKGIFLSQGEYITFVDADDMVENEYFLNFENAIKNDADLFILNNKLIAENGKNTYIEKKFLKSGYIDICTVEKWVIGNKSGAVWDKIFKTKLLKNVMNEITMKIDFGDDILINLLYLKVCKKIICKNYCSYIHNKNSSTSICKLFTMQRLHEIDSLYLFIDKNVGLECETRRIYDNMAVFNFTNTVYKLSKKNSLDEIKDEIDKLESMKILKKTYRPINLKNKIYFKLLINNCFWLIKIIFFIREFLR